MMRKLFRLNEVAVRALNGLAPLADLAVRLAVAEVFWRSGLTKIQSWSTTLTLFEYEYAVPLLPPHVAAYLAAATELSLSPLLALGLGGRYPALGLFLFNLVAATSYPDLSDAGRQFHILWGLLLAVVLTRGPGRLALDTLVCRWLKGCGRAGARR
jgi:putative oxidoreductase